MNRIQIDAPCKVNLSLDIVGKLPNGYHETDMVMQTVSLCDTIFLQLQSGSGQIQMSCRFEPDNGNALSCGEDNIAVRCARAFFRESGCAMEGHDLSIQLVKRIPMMAGLGGGSADGAAVLSGLNLLTGTNLPLEQLEKIALPCGADIPFCLRGGTLRGVLNNLDYLEQLGVNCLYLNPIFVAGAYHKYDTLDYFHVDPALGTDDDLRAYFEDTYYDFDYVLSSLSYKEDTELTGEEGESSEMTEEEANARRELFEGYAEKINAGEMTMEEAAEDFASVISSEDEELTHQLIDGAYIDSYFPDDVRAALDEMADGEVRTLEVSTLSDGILLLQKNAISDAYDTFLETESNRDTLLVGLKSDEFAASVESGCDALEGVTFNDEAISTYKVSEFYTFTPSSSSSAS